MQNWPLMKKNSIRRTANLRGHGRGLDGRTVVRAVARSATAVGLPEPTSQNRALARKSKAHKFLYYWYVCLKEKNTTSLKQHQPKISCFGCRLG